jgi:hypothetical protein
MIYIDKRWRRWNLPTIFRNGPDTRLVPFLLV